MLQEQCDKKSQLQLNLSVVKKLSFHNEQTEISHGTFMN